MASGSGFDTMYLDNLDEYINDENKVVTYHWLSTTLQVHVNQAKQMLFNFVKQQRSEKDSDCLHVTYFIAGIMDKNKEATKVVFCSVVPEEKLETVKSSLQQLYSCHIYSVEKSKLKDSNVLYITNYQKMKENVIESTRYSAIKYDAAQEIQRKVKTEDVQPNSPLKTSNESSVKTNGDSNNNNSSSSTSNSKNSVKKSVIAGMFAQCNKNNISKKTSTDQSSKNSESKNEPADKKGSKKPTGMLSFFNSAVKTESIVTKSDDTESSKNTNNIKHEDKKSLRESDSEDDMFQSKKRRRIVRNAYDSSSSEEEMESEEPLPSPPSPEMMPTDSDIKDDIMEESPATKNGCEQNTEEQEEEAAAVAKETVPEIVVNQNGKRRKRIKRQKKKNFIDDEGYMVTNTVMVSDSTDVSDEETEEKSKPAAAPALLSVAQIKKSVSKANVSDKGQKKQSSLMSFFNKK